MTLTPDPQRLLPMLGHTQGTRSATVCHWRCADQCAQAHPPRSTAAPFATVAATAAARRTVLRGGLGALVVGGVTAGGALPAAAAPAGRPARPAAARPGTGLPFDRLDPAPTADVDELTVPEGYAWTATMAWGDPVVPGAPVFDFDQQSEAAQKQQFGYNNDYVGFVPIAGRNRAAMVVNHEYTNPELMFSGQPSDEAERTERLRIEMAAHGMSVVEVRRRGPRQPWAADARSRINRRVHMQTELLMTGPAAGSQHLQTAADPAGRRVLGTVNNCAGGTTPWGTVLSGEENFQGYFKRGATMDPRNSHYGISSGRGWESVEERWDLGKEPNEANRFGWIVEIDPLDPSSTPRKHTALGRFKHEGANVDLAADGRVVAVMGDDQGNEYLYKFISRRRFRSGGSPQARRHNMTLLEEGDLYVARLDAADDPTAPYDGSGSWLPLVVDGTSKVPGFSVEEVLVFTRAAADTVNPTPMDRPEDVERNPHNGYVYAALTNNTGRTAPGPANPRSNNRYGQVVELREGDPADLTFTWALVVVCGDPADDSTYFSGYPKDQVSPISSPDNVAFDSAGNLWISTDGQGNLGLNDALHLVPVEGPHRGHVQQFLAVPTGAETCGPVIDDESSSVFLAVQHPGDVDGATPENPASQFPYGRTAFPARNVKGPRPAVVQVYRR